MSALFFPAHDDTLKNCENWCCIDQLPWLSDRFNWASQVNANLTEQNTICWLEQWRGNLWQPYSIKSVLQIPTDWENRYLKMLIFPCSRHLRTKWWYCMPHMDNKMSWIHDTKIPNTWLLFRYVTNTVKQICIPWFLDTIPLMCD